MAMETKTAPFCWLVLILLSSLFMSLILSLQRQPWHHCIVEIVIMVHEFSQSVMRAFAPKTCRAQQCITTTTVHPSQGLIYEFDWMSAV
jgi:hypothetical protein